MKIVTGRLSLTRYLDLRHHYLMSLGFSVSLDLQTRMNPYAPPSSEIGLPTARHNFAHLRFHQLAKLRKASHTITAIRALFFFIAFLCAVGCLVGFFLEAPQGALISLVASIPFFLGSFGIAMRNRWGRACGVFCCSVMIPVIPIGTAIGVFGILALKQMDALGEGFVSHGALDAEYKFRKQNGID